MIGRNVALGSTPVGYEVVSSTRLKRKQLQEWNEEGVDIELFLRRHEKKLNREPIRLFYVISPNGQPGIYKIGIAGDSTGEPVSRIKEYFLFYGKESRTNKCTGAKVHFVHTTAYIKDTLKTNSEVWQLERKIKKALSKHAIRGDEWMKTSLSTIENEYNKAIGNIKEKETITRRSLRDRATRDKRDIVQKQKERSQRIRTTTQYFTIEKILSIVEEDGDKYVEVKWEGYPDSENTFEPYEKIAKDAPYMLKEFEKSKRRF